MTVDRSRHEQLKTFRVAGTDAGDGDVNAVAYGASAPRAGQPDRGPLHERFRRSGSTGSGVDRAVGQKTMNAASGVVGTGSGREIKLDPEPTSVRKAREFVRRNLCDLGFPGCVDDGVVVVSELVSNALRAAPQTPCVVVVRVGAGHPVIEVHDGSCESPQRRDPDVLEESGRGLHVVAALCEAWDSVRSNDGKAVIAILRR